VQLCSHIATTERACHECHVDDERHSARTLYRADGVRQARLRYCVHPHAQVMRLALFKAGCETTCNESFLNEIRRAQCMQVAGVQYAFVPLCVFTQLVMDGSPGSTQAHI
jgi:IS5 family transposase